MILVVNFTLHFVQTVKTSIQLDDSDTDGEIQERKTKDNTTADYVNKGSYSAVLSVLVLVSVVLEMSMQLFKLKVNYNPEKACLVDKRILKFDFMQLEDAAHLIPLLIKGI